jgi:hypothetical protein
MLLLCTVPCHILIPCKPVLSCALDAVLQAEVKRRTDSDRQLQTHFDSEIKSLQVCSVSTHIMLVQAASCTWADHMGHQMHRQSSEADCLLAAVAPSNATADAFAAPAQVTWQYGFCRVVGGVAVACTLVFVPADVPRPFTLQDKLNASYAELSGAFKTSLEGLARTVQDLHAIIK